MEYALNPNSREAKHASISRSEFQVRMMTETVTLDAFFCPVSKCLPMYARALINFDLYSAPLSDTETSGPKKTRLMATQTARNSSLMSTHGLIVSIYKLSYLSL